MHAPGKYFRAVALRLNPIGNRVISSFSGQKTCTRIILSMLQSFLHSLNAKDINMCPEITPKTSREDKFPSSEKLCDRR